MSREEDRLLGLARGLVSVDGENPEYDRALVELVSAFAGYDGDGRAWVARRIMRSPTSVARRIDRLNYDYQAGRLSLDEFFDLMREEMAARES